MTGFCINSQRWIFNPAPEMVRITCIRICLSSSDRNHLRPGKSGGDRTESNGFLTNINRCDNYMVLIITVTGKRDVTAGNRPLQVIRMIAVSKLVNCISPRIDGCSKREIRITVTDNTTNLCLFHNEFHTGID